MPLKVKQKENLLERHLQAGKYNVTFASPSKALILLTEYENNFLAENLS